MVKSLRHALVHEAYIMRMFRCMMQSATAVTFVATLSGCASLPTSGPNTPQLLREEQAEADALGFEITDITTENLPEPERLALDSRETLEALSADGRVDLLGPGDVLQIRIFEVGISLFGSSTDIGSDIESGTSFDPSARSQSLDGVAVDASGYITLPYIGKLNVAGRTTEEVRQMIVRGMGGKSQVPQALVSVRENVTNTYVISGLVNSPGRKRLTLGRERILDAIANAGGVKAPATAQNAILSVTRGNRTVETYLESISPGSPADLILLPSDRLSIIQRERTFTVFGAAGKVSEVKFESERLSLSEAIARAGGPSEQLADPTGVFVFRYAAGQQGEEHPTIYRLNMMKPSNYFLAQRFMMRNKDVIYIANARSNQARKLVEILNVIASPFFLARQISR